MNPCSQFKRCRLTEEFNIKFMQSCKSLIKCVFINADGVETIGRTKTIFKMASTGKYHSFFIVLNK